MTNRHHLAAMSALSLAASLLMLCACTAPVGVAAFAPSRLLPKLPRARNIPPSRFGVLRSTSDPLAALEALEAEYKSKLASTHWSEHRQVEEQYGQRLQAARGAASRFRLEQREAALNEEVEAEAERVATEKAGAAEKAHSAEAELIAAEEAAEKIKETEKIITDKAKAEAERIAVEEAEKQRIAAEKAETERIEAQRKAAAEEAEKQRIAAEKAKAAERVEAARIAAEKGRAARIAAEEAERVREAERIKTEKAKAEADLAAEKAEAEAALFFAAEKAEAERQEAAAEEAERQRIAAEKAEADRKAAEAAERQRIAAEKAEADRKAAEEAETKRIAAEKAAAEEAEKQRIAAEKAKAAERVEAARIAAEKGKAARMAEAERKAAATATQLYRDSTDSGTGWDSFSGRAITNVPSGEEQRKFRRTVYTHDDWKKHRSQDRFFYYLAAIFSSGVYKNLGREVGATTAIATFVVLYNAVVGGYTDFAGAEHAALITADFPLKLTLPLNAFTLTSPSLGLLLVFRTNSSYKRWDEARKNWGMNINHTRDLARMANCYYDNRGRSPEQRADDLNHLVLCIWAFVRSMKRHLSPEEEDEAFFREELYEKLPQQQAQMIIEAAHRPNRALQDLSYAIDDLPMHFMRKNEIHTAATIFEDDLGSSERILTSPVPLFYSRHLARFLSVWLLLLPFGIYDAFESSWNHIAMIPATAVISLMLFGIEEIGVQLEEPFTVLPMQAFCDKIYNWCKEIVSWTPGDNGRPMKPVRPEHTYFPKSTVKGGNNARPAPDKAPADIVEAPAAPALKEA